MHPFLAFKFEIHRATASQLPALLATGATYDVNPNLKFQWNKELALKQGWFGLDTSSPLLTEIGDKMTTEAEGFLEE